MNALVISHNFPPLNVVAAYRPYSIARALADAGCRVGVLTSRKTPAFGDLSLPYVREGLEMLEVPMGAPHESARVRWSWVLRAASELRRLARTRGVDLIFSTHGPSSSHVLGAVAAHLWKGAFWVADYRDPWTTSRYERPASRLDPVKHWTERRLVARARLVTAVSRGVADDVASVVPPVPVRIVRNGYDRPVGPAPRDRPHEGPRTLTFTGTIYTRKRGGAVRPLFEALAALDGVAAITPESLRVVFAGSNLDVVAQIAHEHGVERYVSILGMLPRADALALQDRSDALLLIEDGLAAKQGVMTGKIFEYIGAGVPVLAVGPASDTEIGELIAETGAGVCLGEDRSAIAGALRAIVDGRARELAAPNPEAVARYARSRIARDFVEMLHAMGLPLPAFGTPGAAR